ncbi:MAG: DUF485 domain-containing protein [Planctomycetaceae bacterium]|nr:DUF485 domain-containing protein [Planctomycetaceae bacterium]
MLHEPAAPVGRDAAAPFKARLGIWMFLFYCLFYAGFVVINLYQPKWMATEVLAGMNLATVYGFALIAGALVQAVIYDLLCRRREHALADRGGNA